MGAGAGSDITSPIPPAVNGPLGEISFMGYDPTNTWMISSWIRGVASESWSSSAHGTELQFSTTSAGGGAGSPNLSMILLGDGSLDLFGSTLYLGASYNLATRNTPAPNPSALGPWIFGNTANMIFKLGASAGGAFLWQNGSGGQVASIDLMGNAKFGGNYITFENAATGTINTTGGPYLYGDDNFVVAKIGSNNQGVLIQNYAGVNWFQFRGTDPGANTSGAVFSPGRWRFRQVVGDEVSAGTLDYRGFDPNGLSIVGAGTTGSNRLVRIFDNLVMGGTIAVGGGGTVGGDLQVNGGGSAIYTPNGNIVTDQSLYVGGLHAYNNAGWFYFDQGVQAQNLNTRDHLYVNGLSAYNNSGYFYFDNSVNVYDFVSRNNANIAGVVLIAGLEWYNNGGSMWTPNSLGTSGNFNASGSLRVEGNLSTGGNISISNGNGRITAPGSFIMCDSSFLPGTDGAYLCGDSAQAWGAVESYVYYTVSTQEAKTDITSIDLPQSLSLLGRLRPVTFRYTNDGLKDKGLHCGFIAEEAQPILEELIGERPVGKLAYHDFTPLLVGAVQLLGAQVTALQQRIDELENEILKV
jgi:hypothetical protein